MKQTLTLRKLGLVEYQPSYEAMSRFTSERGTETDDEIWCLQHPPVYTLGLAGKHEHILDAGKIPVLNTDRGGQVTYHGPGQLLIYLLLDLRRRKIGIKDYVYLLEQSLIEYLASLGLSAGRRLGAPGVYVDGRKIAALGIRVRKGCCYHGLALNINMDTSPFKGINPCGYTDLEVVQLSEFGICLTMDEVCDGLIKFLLINLGAEHYRVISKQSLTDLNENFAAA